jgi:hypothetical protein
MTQIIHEDPTVPRGKAYMSLDCSEIWCHPDDAASVRESARQNDEAAAEIDRQLKERTAELKDERLDPPTGW